MAVTINGERPGIYDAEGRLWRNGRPADDSSFAMPPVLSNASILNSALQVYSAVRRDDAIRFSRTDALAMERDTFLQAIMLERYEATALLTGHVEPEDPKDPRQLADARRTQKILERTPNFQRLKMQLLYGIWFGRAGTQIVVKHRKGEQIDGRPFRRVVAHSPVRGDKIEFAFQWDREQADRTDGHWLEEGTPLIFMNASYEKDLEAKGAWIHRSDLYRALVLTPGYWRERFIIHKHLCKDWDPFEDPEKQGVIHGFGVRDQIFWLDWIRKEWLANVSDFIDQVGKGCLFYPYDASNPQARDAAMAAAKAQSRNTVIIWPVWPGQPPVMPQPMNIPMAGSETLLKLMEHVEGHIERYIIGQTGSSRSETSGLGTHSGEAMQDTKYRRVRWDAQNLDETITEDLLGPLHRANTPNAGYKLFYHSDVDKPNAAQMLEAGKLLHDMDVPVKSQEMRTYAGFSEPDQDDETISISNTQRKQLEMKVQAEQVAGGGAQAQAKMQMEQQMAQMKLSLEKEKGKAEIQKHRIALQTAMQKHRLSMQQAKAKHDMAMAADMQAHKMSQQAALQDHDLSQKALALKARQSLMGRVPMGIAG
jgi:phage gp29-like protein